MTENDPILALDQGTSSSRALIYEGATTSAIAQCPLEIQFPKNRRGWVEQDPEAIWQTSLSALQQVLAAHAGKPIAALGITNQRETTIVWERASGKPIYNAIVWQDRRTAPFCERLRTEGVAPLIAARTGLVIDPYFSATKIKWILDNVEGARTKARNGELAFGTVESFLIYRLTEGRVHACDATNASRTMLFDIHKNQWDDELLRLFDVPRSLLPSVYDCAADFGEARGLGAGAGGATAPIPIRAAIGDQQSAAVGQSCFESGQAKSTYGTGCFLLSYRGLEAAAPANGLLSTIAFRLQGQTHYAVEGSIFMAGSIVQWLRDKVALLGAAQESAPLAASASDEPVYFVPALSGLGAPYWDAEARGAFFGLTHNVGRAEIVRACLEAVSFQTYDLLHAMEKPAALLRVDGGMARNDWLMQSIADITGAVVERPVDIETTARGAAVMAAVGAGLYGKLNESAAHWQREARFEPQMNEAVRTAKLAGWHEAVQKVLTHKA